MLGAFSPLMLFLDSSINPLVMRATPLCPDIVTKALSIIFEKSWLLGKVPGDWKIENVTPSLQEALINHSNSWLYLLLVYTNIRPM